jgi:hypothetical protein
MPAAAVPAPADLGNPPIEIEIDVAQREIRRRGPTVDTLRQVALDVQLDLIGKQPPMTAAVRAAAERVFSGLYRDADFQDVLTDGVSALHSTSPREIKRYVNLFRFYTFVAHGLRVDGVVEITTEQTAKLAAFAIRWPQVVSLLGDTGSGHPLARLENAARADDEEWLSVLRDVLPGIGEKLPAWAPELRSFLSTGPQIARVAAHLI